MHIMMVSNTYKPRMGGIEHSIEQFSQGLRTQGDRVTIVAPTYEGMEEEQDLIRIPSIHNFYNTPFSLSVPFHGEFSKMMKSNRFDLIHSHQPFVLGDSALRLAYEYELPLVFTYHTLYERYAHLLPGQEKTTTEFLRTLSIQYCNVCDHVIAPTQSIREYLLERGCTRPITVIPTGIDLQRYKQGKRDALRTTLGLSGEAYLMGYAGRIITEKNLPFLMDWLEELLPLYPQVHMVFIGEGEYRREIEKRSREADLSRRIHYSGRLKGEELINAYHALDLFVFPSLTDTQGIVLAEAMACGVPVLAVNAHGARDIVCDKENGRLVQGLDLSRFTDAIRWFLDRSVQDYRQLRDHARKTARKYAMDRSLSSTSALYRKMTMGGETRSSRSSSTIERFADTIQANLDIMKIWFQAFRAAAQS